VSIYFHEPHRTIISHIKLNVLTLLFKHLSHLATNEEMSCLYDAFYLYSLASVFESCRHITLSHFVRPNPQLVVTLGEAFSSLLRGKGCESRAGSFALNVLFSSEVCSGYRRSTLFRRADSSYSSHNSRVFDSKEISCVVERPELLSLVSRSGDAVGVRSTV
jgi:hypothetical protein